MRVKRYVVNALPEAVSMIRTDLGIDAIILNTKEIRVGGFLGMFGKKKMEVIAAIESSDSKQPETAVRKTNPQVNAVVEQILQTAQRANTAELEPTQAPSRASGKSKIEHDDLIVNEIRDLREYMLKLSKGQMSSNQLPIHLAELKDRLSDQELDPTWIDRIIEIISDQQHKEQIEFSKEQVWKYAAEQLEQWMLPFTNGKIDGNSRVVHFVGPTGVGKTTTIAKLAAVQTIKQGKKVGFITSDTYRIAAVDQLRTYANILNVPLEVVFSPMELNKAFKQLADCERIFMDTAGRNFRSELHVSEVNSLLQSNETSETILVLSLTGKSKDMAVVADRFTKYGINKVLFTKIDETQVYGAIFNLIMSYELYPTYVAGGQTVPDDIEPFRIKTYIDLLLGKASNE